MQPPFESDLTDAEIHTLLTAPNVEADFGAEVLNLDLSVAKDISETVEAPGTVEWNGYRTKHRTISGFRTTTELRWGIDLVRPYTTLSANGLAARWNRGVFMLTTPETVAGLTPKTYDVQGYDRILLLERETTADYAATAGTTYRTAILDAFDAAGLSGVLIEGSAADDTLPKDKPWPLVATDQADPDQTNTPVTWLRIINDLLKAINFRAVYCDADGKFRCSAYKPPTSRAPEFTFDADDEFTTIVGEDRSEMVDIWQVPTTWVFRQTNRPEAAPTPTEGDGIYTYELPDAHPLSAVNRELEWPKNVDYEAASQAKLVELGDRHVANDLAVTTTLSMTTGPFPGADHFPIFTVIDSELGGTRKVQAVNWSDPGDGGNVSWQMEVIS